MRHYILSREITLQLFGFIYFCAFISWYVQIEGLYGLQGIFPVKSFLNNARASIGKNSTFLEKVASVPTIAWLYGDLDVEPHALLQGATLLGAFLSLLVIFKFSNSIIMASLWFFYLSIFSVGQTFSGFQWDILLLEAGFLAILYAPILNPRSKSEPPPLVRWLFRWLLFRLMFRSVVESHCFELSLWYPLDLELTTKETQCIPNSIAWFFAQLPDGIQKFSVIVMFIIEIPVPFFVFVPTYFLRNLNALLQIALQLLIIATGNYTFFNILTITLCVPLLDDFIICFLTFRKYKYEEDVSFVPLPAKILNLLVFKCFRFNPEGFLALWGLIIDVYQTHFYFSWNSESLHFFLKYSLTASLYLGAGIIYFCNYIPAMTLLFSIAQIRYAFRYGNGFITKFSRFLHSLIIIAIGTLLFISSTVPFTGRLNREISENLPFACKQAYASIEEFHLTSSYGLFAS